MNALVLLIVANSIVNKKRCPINIFWFKDVFEFYIIFHSLDWFGLLRQAMSVKTEHNIGRKMLKKKYI